MPGFTNRVARLAGGFHVQSITSWKSGPNLNTGTFTSRTIRGVFFHSEPESVEHANLRLVEHVLDRSSAARGSEAGRDSDPVVCINPVGHPHERLEAPPRPSATLSVFRGNADCVFYISAT